MTAPAPVSDRIVLGRTVRATGRRDGRPGSSGRIVEAVSSDGVWRFVAADSTWTVVHVPSGRVLTHAARSLTAACSSAGWLLAELDLQEVPV